MASDFKLTKGNQEAALLTELTDAVNKVKLLEEQIANNEAKYQQLSKQNQELNKQIETLKKQNKNPLELYNLINFSQFQLNKSKILGTGSFGEVYLGSYYELPVAVKMLKTGHDLQVLEDFKNEIQILMYVCTSL